MKTKRVTPENYYGLLFVQDMVKAILRKNDPKTNTRRLRGLKEINENPDQWEYYGNTRDNLDVPHPAVDQGQPHPIWYAFHDKLSRDVIVKCPYGKPGDILWVKEAYAKDGDRYIYKADELYGYEKTKWKSSLLMPFVAARIFLEIKTIRVERIQSITVEDCLKEGINVDPLSMLDHSYGDEVLGRFKTLWINMHPGSWEKNDYVWVVEFKRKLSAAEEYINGNLSLDIGVQPILS